MDPPRRPNCSRQCRNDQLEDVMTRDRITPDEADLVALLVTELRREVAAQLVALPTDRDGVRGLEGQARERLARRLVAEALDRHATASLSAGRPVLDAAAEA